MPDSVFLPERIEVTGPIPASPAATFDILRSHAGHVGHRRLWDAAGRYRRTG